MHVIVSIIGLNRLSTSLALALKRYQGQPKAQHTFTITGSDERDSSMKVAQKLGALDRSERKPLKAAENADLIVMNAPAGQLERSARTPAPAATRELANPGPGLCGRNDHAFRRSGWSSRDYRCPPPGTGSLSPTGLFLGRFPAIGCCLPAPRRALDGD